MTNEEAKAIISNEYKCVDRDCDIERSCGKCDLMMPNKEPILKAYKLAIKALEQTTWIPVSERLPDKYTYTLWCASSGYVRSDYFNGEFWEDAKKLGYEVIAWMPLPEPYKGE